MLLGIVENRSSEMGLSSKQVSCDLQAWNHSLLQANDVVTCTTTSIAGATPTIRTSITNTNTTLELPKPPLKRAQPNQPQPDQLKCPRCDSSNTKFCYYNNYNKSQPRHFCKACKRHWTKGGTLRNVPVGGGRKNKRLKPSPTSGPPSGPASTPTTTKRLGFTTAKLSTHTRMGIQSQDQRPTLPLSLGDDDKINIAQTMLNKPHGSLSQQDHRIFDNSAMDFGILKTSNSSGLFLGTSALALPQISSQDHLGLFPYSTLTSLDENFSNSILNSSTSTHTSASHVYGYISDQSTSLEETPVVTSGLDGNITYNSMSDHTWIKSVDAAANQLGWEEIDKFVSSDIMISWDDPDIK